VPVQVTFWMPPGRPPAGTWNARPLRNISSLPLTGTVTSHLWFTVSNETTAQVAEEENLIEESGTANVWFTPFAVNEIVEFVKVTVLPVLGIPVAAKLALNQINLPPAMGVPLKLAIFELLAVQAGGGGGGGVVGQTSGLVEKLMLAVLPEDTTVAVPLSERVATGNRPSGIVAFTVSVDAFAVKSIAEEMAIGEPEFGVTVIE
jgi:hypothetical protein